MMSERRLANSLNDCLDRLADGQTLDDCLSHYPESAAELRSLLMVGQLPRQAHADAAEVSQMRSRLDAHMDRTIEATDFRRGRVQIPPGGMVLLLVAAVMLVLGIFLVLWNNTRPVVNTTAPVTLAVTVTDAATSTPEATPSPVQTAIPTQRSIIQSTATDAITSTSEATSTPVQTAIPTQRSIIETTTTPPGCRPTRLDGWAQYRVKSGDTLSGIATQSGTTTAILAEVNCLDDDLVIIVGQGLFVPHLWETEATPEAESESDVPDEASTVDDESDEGSESSESSESDESDEASESDESSS